MTDATDVQEERITLGRFDVDHLLHGQPVFKGVGDDIRLVLVFDEYDDYEVPEGENDG